MKRFHEVGSILDKESRITGFVLCNVETGQYLQVNNEEFTRMVGDNHVQYFELSPSGAPIIQYTEEELREVSSATHGASPAIDDIDLYLRNDTKFKREHVELSFKEGSDLCIGFALASPVMPFVGSMLSLCILNTGKPTERIIEKVKSSGKIAVQGGNAFGCPMFMIYVNKLALTYEMADLFKGCYFSTYSLDNPEEISQSENLKKAGLLSSIMFRGDADAQTLSKMKQFVEEINKLTGSGSEIKTSSFFS